MTKSALRRRVGRAKAPARHRNAQKSGGDSLKKFPTLFLKDGQRRRYYRGDCDFANFVSERISNLVLLARDHAQPTRSNTRASSRVGDIDQCQLDPNAATQSQARELDSALGR